MASISDIRSGIATNLATISGLRTSATIPDQPVPPVAIVILSTVEYNKAMARGLNLYNFIVQVIVGRADERTAQNNLDAYVSPTGNSSVKLAVESDRTLGGVVDDCLVTDLRNVGSLTYGDQTYLAAEFAVTVYAN